MFIAQVATIDSHYGFRLSWAPSDAQDFSHYSVYMSQQSGRNYKHLGDTNVPELMILDLAPGTYYFVVYAIDKGDNRSKPNEEFRITVS